MKPRPPSPPPPNPCARRRKSGNCGAECLACSASPGHLAVPAPTTPARAWSDDDPRRVKQAETRNTLLDAAKRIFLAEGYHGTSMQDIADRAGISKMTLYRHFKEKEELFLALFFEQCLNLARNRQPVLPARDLAGAALALGTFASHLVHAITVPEILSLYRMLIGEVGRFPELGKAFFVHGPRRDIEAIERILSGILPAAEARDRAEAFFALVLGTAHQRLLLGTLPKEEQSGAFQTQIRQAIGLALAAPTGPKRVAPRRRVDRRTRNSKPS